MEEYYFETAISNSKVLCVGPVTREEAADAAVDEDYCNGLGYYLFVANAQEPRNGIEILARVFSEESARRLCDILKYRLAAA